MYRQISKRRFAMLFIIQENTCEILKSLLVFLPGLSTSKCHLQFGSMSGLILRLGLQVSLFLALISNSLRAISYGREK